MAVAGRRAGKRDPHGATRAVRSGAASNGEDAFLGEAVLANSVGDSDFCERPPAHAASDRVPGEIESGRQALLAVIAAKTILDNEALRVKDAGVAQRALKAGQRAPDFELPDMSGNWVSLAKLRASGPLALIFYRGLW